MNYLSIYVAIFVSCELCGCATQPVPRTDNAQGTIDRHILEASQKIERMQLQLVQSGAYGHAPKTAPGAYTADQQTISFSWEGDAYQLLSKLASDRGLEFVTVGVRLPLPVAIQVKDKSLEEVLAVIRAQTGYRAAVLLDPTKLTILFNRPQEGRS